MAAPSGEYYCHYCGICGTEYAGWGELPEDFDPDNFCECPPENPRYGPGNPDGERDRERGG
jgi:hypothetical protein